MNNDILLEALKEIKATLQFYPDSITYKIATEAINKWEALAEEKSETILLNGLLKLRDNYLSGAQKIDFINDIIARYASQSVPPYKEEEAGEDHEK